MNSALLIRLRPLGPWRYGPGEGGRDRVDLVFRSDRLFSAVTLAMKRLGHLEEWLDATARSSNPAVAFSSFFPFQGDTLFAPPPATLWPPPAGALRMSSPVFQSKVRWRAARFVPVNLIETLLLSQRIVVEQWIADAESGCLLRRDRPQSSPFRTVIRTQAAVDRLTGAVESHSLACVEFEPGSGLWTAAGFADDAARDRWREPLKAAFRLLSDTGFGGRRSSGWGQAAPPEFEQGGWPALVFPKLSRSMTNGSSAGHEQAGENPHHWLLSLFSPGPEDSIDWSGGHYALVTRGGRVENGSGHGAEKKMARFVEEGSVLASSSAPLGTAVNVAPNGFEHPVYRAGMALSIRLPLTRFAGTEDEPKQMAERSDERPETESVTPEPETSELPDREQDRDEFWAEQPGGEEVPLEPTDVDARREEAELDPETASGGGATGEAEQRFDHLLSEGDETASRTNEANPTQENGGEQAGGDEVERERADLEPTDLETTDLEPADLEPTDIEARLEEAQSASTEPATGVEDTPETSARTSGETTSRETDTPPSQREPENPTLPEREPDDAPEPPVEEPDEHRPEGDPPPDEPPQQVNDAAESKRESGDEL